MSQNLSSPRRVYRDRSMQVTLPLCSQPGASLPVGDRTLRVSLCAPKNRMRMLLNLADVHTSTVIWQRILH